MRVQNVARESAGGTSAKGQHDADTATSSSSVLCAARVSGRVILLLLLFFLLILPASILPPPPHCFWSPASTSPPWPVGFLLLLLLVPVQGPPKARRTHPCAATHALYTRHYGNETQTRSCGPWNLVTKNNPTTAYPHSPHHLHRTRAPTNTHSHART